MMRKIIVIWLCMILIASVLGSIIPTNTSAYTTHDPIYIDGNANFTAENGVIGGTGTQSDPYIIEGLDINTSSSDGIEIRNTDVYFIVRNCYVHGGPNYGIYLYNVKNGRIENTISSSNDNGIYLFSSLPEEGSINIYNNTITNNRDGVTVESIGEVVIEKNEISENSESGIKIVRHPSSESSNVLIKENTIKQNQNGIATDFSYTHSGIVVTGNTILSNQENGIYLCSNSDPICDDAYIYDVTVSNNTVLSNGGNGIYLRSYGQWGGHIRNVIVSSNNVSSNLGKGIYLESRSSAWGAGTWISNSDISSNTISSNGGDGINLYTRGGYGGSINRNIKVSSNTVSSNNGDGVRASVFNYYEAGDSEMSELVFSSNKVLSNLGNGVCLYSSGGWGTFGYCWICNSNISSNNILSNGGDGMFLHSSSGGKAWIYDVTALSNTVSSNNINGIYIAASHYKEGLLYDFAISENTISANSQKGIWVDGGINANLTRNSISYNMYGVFYIETTGNLAQYNDIYHNSYGMNVTNGATVNAENNYWGNASGPYHESLNVNGTGNSVNGNGADLDFIPFLTDPVGDINERPVAVLVADETTVEVNQTVTFDASSSTDDGRIDYYFFDFGDGLNSGWTTLPIVTHKYASRGIYNATLIVMDNLGVTTSLDGDLAYVAITVLAPPVAHFTYSPEFSLIDTLITFNASASYDSDGTIESYTWNFGDGNITIVTTPITTRVYTAPNTYTVNLTVTDNDGLSNSTTKFVVVITTISGVVKDKDGNPIEGATVTIYESGTTTNPVTSTTTNSNGEYSVDVSPGMYDIKIEKSGYETQWEKDVEVTADQTATGDSTLPLTTDILGDYWWAILLVVIIVVVVVVLGMLRRKKGKELEQSPDSEDA